MVLGCPFFIVFVCDVSDIDPGVRHFVHGPVAIADPLLGSGLLGLVRGVVMPRRDVNDGPFGENGSIVVRVDVVRHPIEVEVIHITERA